MFNSHIAMRNNSEFYRHDTQSLKTIRPRSHYRERDSENLLLVDNRA